MNIKDLMDKYQKNGYDYVDSQAKICQDILLLKISTSKFSENVTIKGGVVMHNISNDKRRATSDLDLDFIKYSLSDVAIRDFIKQLNRNSEDVKMEIVGNIVGLHQQNYNGKRVFIKITDKYNYYIETKLDIGVHKEFDIEQDKYCFNLDLIGKKVNLFINSPEQIFTEKLKALLKLGIRSTRYKDIFDYYYLINEYELDKDKLYQCITRFILLDDKMRENSIADIVNRIRKIFNSKQYKNNLTNPKVNWLDIEIDGAIYSVLNYLESLQEVYI